MGSETSRASSIISTTFEWLGDRWHLALLRHRLTEQRLRGTTSPTTATSIPSYGDTRSTRSPWLAEARRRDIAVLLDLVPNHTSSRHPLVRRCLAPQGAHLDPSRLVRVGRPGSRRQSAEQLGQHLRRPGVDVPPVQRPVLPAQLLALPSPTSTGGTPTCVRPFAGSSTSGGARGVAGFRIDVCNMIVKDAELHDDPPGHTRGLVHLPGVRSTVALQRQPPGGARRHSALAIAVGRGPTEPGPPR